MSAQSAQYDESIIAGFAVEGETLPMALNIICPSCQTHYLFVDQAAGAKVRCKKCQHVIRVDADAPRVQAPARRRRSRQDDDGEDEPTSKAMPWIVGGGAVALLVVAVIVGIVLLGKSAAPPKNQGPAVASMPAGSAPAASAAAPAPPATWPALGPARVVEPGVRLHEVFLRAGDPSSKVWVYLPENASPKLPCVLIAPAGSIMVTGMELGDGDRPEHLPYIKAGFAVIAYAISGHCDTGPSGAPARAALVPAATAFKDAGAGVVNARQALDFGLARVPQIDARRVYSAGHSSAATLSLLLAEKEPRIAACVAYAPVTDVVQRVQPLLRSLSAAIPGFTEFISDHSPQTHAHLLKCPLFIFHARDDNVVPFGQTERFVQKVQSVNPRVKFVAVNRGGHHQSMIDQGIPQAIRWLQDLSPPELAGRPPEGGAQPRGAPAAPPAANAGRPRTPPAGAARGVRTGRLNDATGETEVMGGGFDPPFRDEAPAGGLLIGFEVGLGKFGSNDVIRAIRAVFRNADGTETLAKLHGTQIQRVVTVKAKPGFAVGAIIGKAGLTMDGFSVTFMAVGPDGLDANSAYSSEWIGGKGGGTETQLGGTGAPVIGILGKENKKDCTGLGLLLKH